MTDVVTLAQKLYESINQQNVPEEIDQTDLVRLIIDAIETLYVISGRTFLWSDDKVLYDERSGVPYAFEDTLA